MKREAKKREEETKESMKERRNSPTLALLFTDWDFHWLKMGLGSRSRNLPSETDKGATWTQSLTRAQRVSQKMQLRTENWKGGTCTEDEAGRCGTRRSHRQDWWNGYTRKVLAAHDWEPEFRSLALWTLHVHGWTQSHTTVYIKQAYEVLKKKKELKKWGNASVLFKGSMKYEIDQYLPRHIRDKGAYG